MFNPPRPGQPASSVRERRNPHSNKEKGAKNEPYFVDRPTCITNPVGTATHNSGGHQNEAVNIRTNPLRRATGTKSGHIAVAGRYHHLHHPSRQELLSIRLPAKPAWRPKKPRRPVHRLRRRSRRLCGTDVVLENDREAIALWGGVHPAPFQPGL